MSPATFRFLYTSLMLGAGVTVFLPAAVVGDRVRNSAVAALSPVAKPSRAIGDWFAGKIGPLDPLDPDSPLKARDVKAVYDENVALRVEVQSLANQLDDLKRLNADRQQLGRLRPLCEPAAVLGGDSGGRQSLAISTTALPGRTDDAPVLTANGLVGRIAEGVGVGAARVRLITDRTSRLNGRIERFVTQPDGTIDRLPIVLKTDPLVEGAGPLGMTMQMPEYDAKLLRAGDIVLLDDSAWPEALRGLRVGRVAKIEATPSAPGFFDLTVEPTMDLARLREVQVMVRGK